MTDNIVTRLGKHIIALVVMGAWLVLCYTPTILVVYSDSNEVITQYWPHWFNALMVVLMLPGACLGPVLMLLAYGWAREMLGLPQMKDPRSSSRAY